MADRTVPFLVQRLVQCLFWYSAFFGTVPCMILPDIEPCRLLFTFRTSLKVTTPFATLVTMASPSTPSSSTAHLISRERVAEDLGLDFNSATTTTRPVAPMASSLATVTRGHGGSLSCKHGRLAELSAETESWHMAVQCLSLFSVCVC